MPTTEPSIIVGVFSEWHLRQIIFLFQGPIFAVSLSRYDFNLMMQDHTGESVYEDPIGSADANGRLDAGKRSINYAGGRLTLSGLRQGEGGYLGAAIQGSARYSRHVARAVALQRQCCCCFRRLAHRAGISDPSDIATLSLNQFDRWLFARGYRRLAARNTNMAGERGREWTVSGRYNVRFGRDRAPAGADRRSPLRRREHQDYWRNHVAAARAGSPEI